jgi:hypothetical protein
MNALSVLVVLQGWSFEARLWWQHCSQHPLGVILGLVRTSPRMTPVEALWLDQVVNPH